MVKAAHLAVGMRIWGAQSRGHFVLQPHAASIDEPIKFRDSTVRVEVADPVEGPVFHLYEPDQLVLVDVRDVT